jgi:hypothetical protein
MHIRPIRYIFSVEATVGQLVWCVCIYYIQIYIYIYIQGGARNDPVIDLIIEPC